MRLAFCLFKYFPYSGLARDMLRIADEAVGRGHAVDIYAREWQGEPPAGAPVTVLPSRGLTNHSRGAGFARRLAERLEGRRYDAVVGFNKLPGLDFYYAADGCFAARARHRYPRAYELTPRYRSLRHLEESVFSTVSRTRIMLLSEQAGLEYRAFYDTPEERLRLLPPGLDAAHRAGPLDPERRTAVRAALGAGEQDALVFVVGSGFRTKGVDRVLVALSSLPDRLRSSTRLAVVGHGKDTDYRRLAGGLGIAQNVVFTGGRSDVPELLRAGDLLVHPARQENTGTVILEALAAALPVLTTANCGYARHVREARAGTVLDVPFDQQAFNRALEALLSRPGRNALRESASRYGQSDTLYRMPGAAVDLIEDWRDEAPRLGFRGYLHPELYGLSRRLPRLEDWLAIEGDVFRRAPDRTTLRFEHDGRGYFLKAHFGVGWREILKNLVQMKLPVLDAGNEWLAIHLLQALGVPTLSAAAHGRGTGLSSRKSFIITRELAGMISLEQYAAQGGGRDRSEVLKRRRFIRAVAATARTLHTNGVNHRDLYLCHFLFDPDEAADPHLHLIDLHRAQVRHRTPERWCVKDIGGLYYSAGAAALTRTERLRFIKTYAGTGSLRAALLDRRFWSRVHRRARALKKAEDRRGHADPAGAAKQLN